MLIKNDKNQKEEEKENDLDNEEKNREFLNWMR